MKVFSLLCSLFCFCHANAQNWQFSTSAIPDSLKKNADVIVHLDNSELKIEGPDNAVMTRHKIFTVLSEEGRYALGFSANSTKFATLGDVEVKVYNQDGKQLNKYKKKDMTTVSIGEGLIEDGYVTSLGFGTTSYPVTVDIKFEMKLRNSFDPPFYFIHTKEGVVDASYSVTLPSSMTLRYKPFNTSITPKVSESGSRKTYQWNVKNLPPLEYEEGSADASSRYPHVKIATDQSSFYGVEGDGSSWKSIGEWLNRLYKDQDELPEEKKAFLINLVKDAPYDYEKARRIYGYLQDNFRYVSIQLGIGGLKPFSATFTDQKKYGDCKALSNYMKAALKVVGIKSYVAIINSEYNAEPVDPTFPSFTFNHVILCVPAKDTIWLECTSPIAEFGKLGTFTENRNALLVTENGGVLVATPKSDPSANTFATRTVVKIEGDLSAIAETLINSTGSFSAIMEEIVKAKHDDQKTAIIYYLGYKQPDDFSMTSDNNSHQITLKLAIRKVPEFNSGDKYFFNPRINKVWSSKLPSAQNRKMDFYFRFPFEQHDTTILTLNPTLKTEALPQEKEIKTDYGYYHSKTWFNEKENAVYTATTLILKRHKVLAKDYATVKSFFDEVMQDDSQRIVMKRTEIKDTEKKTF